MGRIEILTGAERRRDWSDNEKLSILQEAAGPDAKIAASLDDTISNRSRFIPGGGSLQRSRVSHWFLSCQSH